MCTTTLLSRTRTHRNGHKDWIPLNYKECQLIDQYVYLNKEKTITGINLCIKLLDDRLKRDAEDVGQEWFPLEETHFIPTDPAKYSDTLLKQTREVI